MGYALRRRSGREDSMINIEGKGEKDIHSLNLAKSLFEGRKKI